MLNSLSVRGIELQRIIEERRLTSLTSNEALLLFEISSDEIEVSLPELDNDIVQLVSSAEISLICYGNYSMNVIQNIKARFSTHEVIDKLQWLGIKVKGVDDSRTVNEFMNSSIVVRTDLSIHVQYVRNIEKITTEQNIKNIHEEGITIQTT